MPTKTPTIDEIEVTREMIDAGLEVLEESGRLINDQLFSGDGLLVQRIFRAMRNAHTHKV